MFTIDLSCPNCRNNRGMRAWAMGEFEIISPEKITPPHLRNLVRPEMLDPDAIIKATCCCTCTLCHQPVMVSIAMARKMFDKAKACVNSDEGYRGPAPEVLQIWPAPVKPYTHPSFPAKLNDLFIDFQDIFAEGKDPAIVVGGCRNVLEFAVNDQKAKGSNLCRKICDLQAKGVISELLAEWAHYVRLEGNEAIHEIKATSEEAEEMIDFTKIFLQYLYELPSRIKEARQR